MVELLNMPLFDFLGMGLYLKNQEKKSKGGIVQLKDSQKDMIEKARKYQHGKK